MKSLKLLGAWVFTVSGCIAFARFVRRGVFKKNYIGILAYHHISAQSPGPVSPVATSPGVFSDQVKKLTRIFQTFLMKDVSGFLHGEKRLVHDGLILTFDDGYEDAFLNAAPLLEAHGIYGVFYVTAVPFSGRLYLWNDIVGEALNSLGTQNLDDLDFGPQEFRKLLKKIAARTGTKKKHFIQQAFNFLLDEEQIDRDKISILLNTVLKKNKAVLGPDRTLMNREQIVDLARRGHEIGAHTLTHARLSKSGENAKKEIIDSIRILREKGIPVSSFAYPFGHETDIDFSCIDTLKLAGISNAVTMEENIVAQSSDVYLLPRIPVSPHHGASFIMAKFEFLAWRRLVWSWLHSRNPMKMSEQALYKVA